MQTQESTVGLKMENGQTIAMLMAALESIATDLEAEVRDRHGCNAGAPLHEAVERRLWRDLSTVRCARELIKSIKEPRRIDCVICCDKPSGHNNPCAACGKSA